MTLISEHVARSPHLPRPNLTGPVGFAIEFRKMVWRLERTLWFDVSVPHRFRRIVQTNLHALLMYRAYKVFYYKFKKTPESIKRLTFTSSRFVTKDGCFVFEYVCVLYANNKSKSSNRFVVFFYSVTRSRNRSNVDFVYWTPARSLSMKTRLVVFHFRTFTKRPPSIDTNIWPRTDVFTIERAIFGNWDKTRTALKWQLYRNPRGVSTYAVLGTKK